MNDRPHPAPDESLPSYAARMYDALGIDDLYDDDAWVERATSEGLPNASAEPDRPATVVLTPVYDPALPYAYRKPALLHRIQDWFRR